MQLKEQNLRSLYELSKMIENINLLDLSFITKKEEAETKLKEAKQNYYSALKHFEVYLRYTI